MMVPRYTHDTGCGPQLQGMMEPDHASHRQMPRIASRPAFANSPIKLLT